MIEQMNLPVLYFKRVCKYVIVPAIELYSDILNLDRLHGPHAKEGIVLRITMVFTYSVY